MFLASHCSEKETSISQVQQLARQRRNEHKDALWIQMGPADPSCGEDRKSAYAENNEDLIAYLPR